jgi:hypothetical protein
MRGISALRPYMAYTSSQRPGLVCSSYHARHRIGRRFQTFLRWQITGLPRYRRTVTGVPTGAQS